jgi:uracil DNA glycosylase
LYPKYCLFPMSLILLDNGIVSTIHCLPAMKPQTSLSHTEISRTFQHIIQSDIYIVPEPCDVFDIFYKMRPDDIRLAMFGQDPYPGRCPVTQHRYACGTAFAIHEKCKIIPPTLCNIRDAIHLTFPASALSPTICLHFASLYRRLQVS